MIVLCAIGAGLYVYRTLDSLLFGAGTPPGKTVTVKIPPDSSVGQIGDILDAAGVVANGQAWALRVRIDGDGGDLLPGTYHLRQHEHYGRLLAILKAGPPHPKVRLGPVVKLTIPEGLRIREVARRLAPKVGVSPQAYRNAVAHAAPPRGYRPTGNEQLTMEGFLFPATYDLRKPTTARTLVADQLTAFRQAQSRVDFRYAARHKLTRYDVLIIASLIEREAAYPGDRAKIAAVIYNRLRAGMPLAIDATLQYANGSWRPLRASDLSRAGPFNTRTHTGLPPTPICNPGLASMQAAAHPAKVPYLYYVAIPHDPKRRHFFTASYSAFLRFQQEHPASG